jgi:uncharacterized delta-60 repeat protein
MLAMGVPTQAETEVPEPAEIYAIISPMGGVAVQPDGKIVVSCGSYLYAVDTASGVISLTSSGAFRFHSDGSLDRTFQCNIEPVNNSAPQHTHITSTPDGRLLLTGVFHAVDGKPRNGYAMILPDGKLDDSFEPWRGQTNAPGRSGIGPSLYPVALLTNGCIAVPSEAIACRYPYPAVYVLDRSGAFLPRPGIDTISNDMPRCRMIALKATGLADMREMDALFKEVPIELCRYAIRLPDGGAILAVEGTNGSHLMRFDSAWRPDFSFTNTFVTHANSFLTLIHQKDDKLLLAGEISKLNHETFPGLVRLLPDGSTDPGFHCVIGGDTRVMGVALQDDGCILIVGYFSEVNGVKCPYFARLNPDGSLDKDFQKHFTTHENLKAWRRVPVQMLAAASNSSTNSTKPTATPATGIASAPQTVLITSLNLTEGVAIIQFQGNPSQTYILQSRAALDASSWSSIVTNQTDSAGTGIFRDDGAKNFPMRFYRVASPQ